MMTSHRGETMKRDSTLLVQTASQVASGLVSRNDFAQPESRDELAGIARLSVSIADAIITEVERRTNMPARAPQKCKCKTVNTAFGEMVTELCIECSKEQR